jgi:hypothetical protein
MFIIKNMKKTIFLEPLIQIILTINGFIIATIN